MFKNLKFSKNFIYLLFIFSFICFFICDFYGITDIWFLFSHGRYVLNNGFPIVDILSMHEGLNFVMQQWLTAVIFFVIHNYLGKISFYIFLFIINYKLALVALLIFILDFILVIIFQNIFTPYIEECKILKDKIIVNNDFVLDIESGTFSERKKEEERSEDYRKRRIVYNGEEMTFLEYINKLRNKNDANKKLITTFIRNDMFKDFLSLDGIIESLDNLYHML